LSVLDENIHELVSIDTNITVLQNLI